LAMLIRVVVLVMIVHTMGSAPTPKSIDSKCHSITRPVPISGVACRDVCEFPLAQHSIAL
jgi:hypothetical protein